MTGSLTLANRGSKTKCLYKLQFFPLFDFARCYDTRRKASSVYCLQGKTNLNGFPIMDKHYQISKHLFFYKLQEKARIDEEYFLSGLQKYRNHSSDRNKVLT